MKIKFYAPSPLVCLLDHPLLMVLLLLLLPLLQLSWRVSWVDSGGAITKDYYYYSASRGLLSLSLHSFLRLPPTPCPLTITYGHLNQRGALGADKRTERKSVFKKEKLSDPQDWIFSLLKRVAFRLL